MRENDFEHQVQQKMGEFQPSPSDDVWIEVERRIREEKKRRFIFWWPLLFLLAGGGITAAIMFSNKKEKIEKITATKNPEKFLSSSSEKIPVQDPINNSNNTVNKDTVTTLDLTTIVNERINEKISTPVLSTSNLATIDRKKETQTNTIIKKETDQKENKKDIVNSEKPIVNIEKDPAISGNVSLKPIATEKDSTSANDLIVSIKQEVVDNTKTEQQSIKKVADSIVQEQIMKPVEKKTKHLDWGITFYAGQSSLINGLLFSKALSFADAFQTTSPPSLNSRSASTIRPAFSWSGGLYLKQILSKKLTINWGLSYAYFSTRTKVGNRVDSVRVINNSNSPGLSVNQFYRAANTTSYTNKYHFINLSGDLAWRIIDGKKIKLYWENGFSYSRLVGSGMLHFDRSLPGYYTDNSLLTKNHLFFTTGLSVPIGKRVMLNPFASNNLTRVFKNSDTVRINYRNFGIRIRILMNKK